MNDAGAATINVAQFNNTGRNTRHILYFLYIINSIIHHTHSHNIIPAPTIRLIQNPPRKMLSNCALIEPGAISLFSKLFALQNSPQKESSPVLLLIRVKYDCV